jgi:hypothetical protein
MDGQCEHKRRRADCRVCDPVGYARSLIRNAKKRSKQQPEVQPEWIAKKLEEGCPVLGAPFSDGALHSQRQQPMSPTLDKFDPKGEYTKSNVWVISSKANTIKSDATTKEILQVYCWTAIVDTLKRTLSATQFWLARATMITRHEELTKQILEEFK